jgi:hypothetical protein
VKETVSVLILGVEIVVVFSDVLVVVWISSVVEIELDNPTFVVVLKLDWKDGVDIITEFLHGLLIPSPIKSWTKDNQN